MYHQRLIWRDNKSQDGVRVYSISGWFFSVDRFRPSFAWKKGTLLLSSELFWQQIWAQCGGIFKFILAGSTWLDKLRDLKNAPHWVQNLISRCVPSQTEVWLSCSQWSLVCIHKNFNRLLFRSEYAQDLSARGFPHEIVSSLYLPTFYWHLLTRWN